MRKFILAAALAAVAAPIVPAAGDPPPWAPAHGRRAKEEWRDYHRYDYAGPIGKEAAITRITTIATGAITSRAGSAPATGSIAAVTGAIIAAVPTERQA